MLTALVHLRYVDQRGEHTISSQSMINYQKLRKDLPGTQENIEVNLRLPEISDPLRMVNRVQANSSEFTVEIKGLQASNVLK